MIQIALAPFPPIQFLKKSPREKEKAWKGGTGRGRTPSLSRCGRIVRVTTHAERAISSRKKFALGGSCPASLASLAPAFDFTEVCFAFKIYHGHKLLSIYGEVTPKYVSTCRPRLAVASADATPLRLQNQHKTLRRERFVLVLTLPGIEPGFQAC